MSKKYNVGVIGYGWVATAHIPAINATAQAQVTAVARCHHTFADALRILAMAKSVGSRLDTRKVDEARREIEQRIHDLTHS